MGVGAAPRRGSCCLAVTDPSATVSSRPETAHRIAGGWRWSATIPPQPSSAHAGGPPVGSPGQAPLVYG